MQPTYRNLFLRLPNEEPLKAQSQEGLEIRYTANLAELAALKTILSQFSEQNRAEIPLKFRHLTHKQLVEKVELLEQENKELGEKLPADRIGCLNKTFERRHSPHRPLKPSRMSMVKHREEKSE